MTKPRTSSFTLRRRNTKRRLKRDSDVREGGGDRPRLLQQRGRRHLSSLGSPGFYCKTAEALGKRQILFEDLTHQLVRHYVRVLEETEAHEADLIADVTSDYVANMKKGLQHWIDGGRNGHLAWGIFNFGKL